MNYRGISYPVRPGNNGLFDFENDINLIKGNIIQILGTRRGERVMLSLFGSRILDFIHEPLDHITCALLRFELIDAISMWEPRIVLDRKNTSITPFPQQFRVKASIWYFLKTHNQNQTLVLEINRKRRYFYMAGLNRFNYTGRDHQAIADLLLFYLDRQANETYLPTATERQNLINICKLIGYTPKTSKPAQAVVTVSLNSHHERDVILPAYSVLETQSGLTFETQNRCVTQQDYEAFAAKFNGIAKAKAFVRERTDEANIVRLYVLSYGNIAGTVAFTNQSAKYSLLAYLDNYKMLTDWIEIENGKWKFFDFTGRVIVSDGLTPNSMRESINSALLALMDIETHGQNF